MTKKERTLDEFRQVKDSVYITPKTKVTHNYYKIVNFDQKQIVDLIKRYPNDKELGREIRSYYQTLWEKEKKIK